MNVEQTDTAKIRNVEDTLAEFEGLIAALQICLWDLSQETMTGSANRARSATIAVGDALEAKFAEHYPFWK